MYSIGNHLIWDAVTLMGNYIMLMYINNVYFVDNYNINNAIKILDVIRMYFIISIIYVTIKSMFSNIIDIMVFNEIIKDNSIIKKTKCNKVSQIYNPIKLQEGYEPIKLPEKYNMILQEV